MVFLLSAILSGVPAHAGVYQPIDTLGLPYGLTHLPPATAYLNLPATNTGAIPALLSQTRAFGDVATLVPASGLIPYGVIVPLWSDGALKSRWFALPGDGVAAQIGFTPAGEWSFPDGTVFIKHFELATDETAPTVRRRLETRFLVRQAGGGVYGVTYRWRADNSDADLLSGARTEDITIKTASGTRTQTWYYPSRQDCLACHTAVSGYVLGLKTRQLNCAFTYPGSEVTDNQLRTLNQLGLFSPAITNENDIAALPRLSALTDSTASLEERARSYLDANCAQCHRPGGTGPTFDARHSTPLANQHLINATLVKGNVGADNARAVAPKDIWRSAVYFRMGTTDPLAQMPTLARNLVDTSALAVLADWINSLPGIPALAPPVFTPTGGSLVAGQTVAIQATNPAAQFRYTLDRTDPTTNSPLYAGAIRLTNTVTLKARAFADGFVDSIVSSAVFAVKAGVALGNPTFGADGRFQFNVTATAGKTYRLESSTDFAQWTILGTNVPATAVFELLDPLAPEQPRKFYRVIQQP